MRVPYIGRADGPSSRREEWTGPDGAKNDVTFGGRIGVNGCNGMVCAWSLYSDFLSKTISG